MRKGEVSNNGKDKMQGIVRRLGGANNSSEMHMQSAFAQEFLYIKKLNS